VSDVVYLLRLISVVLEGAPFPSPERALPLLLGTAAQESGLVHFRQLGGGPARGLWQMEPATAASHWGWIVHQKGLKALMVDRSGVGYPDIAELECNLPYQILMARIHYFRRDPQPLPDVNALAEQARRWKRYYNTPAGKGTELQYLRNWERLVAGKYPVPPSVPQKENT
jgi:hypothetical protein